MPPRSNYRMLKETSFTKENYGALKASFVKAWAIRELGLNLDSEQSIAISQIGKNLKVTARAGSGKT